MAKKTPTRNKTAKTAVKKKLAKKKATQKKTWATAVNSQDTEAVRYDRKKKATAVIRQLKKLFPVAECALDHDLSLIHI